MGEFILFWVLASGHVGSQRGFDDKGCAEAAQRMRVAVTQSFPETDVPMTSDRLSTAYRSTRGEIWCSPARG